MSWKKNVFSCLMWVVYLLIVGMTMIFTGRAICVFLGMAEYFGFVMPAVCMVLTGALVFLLHRMAVRLAPGSRSEGKGLIWLERILVFVLFAVGIFLRVKRIQSGSMASLDEAVYLKQAYIISDEQGIPRVSHGAAYLYLWVLRLFFILLGNKAAVAVYLQIALQVLSVLLLYMAVRKMAGGIPAVMMVSFFMLAPYMVGKSLILSPEMLYLLFFSFVLLFISQGVKYMFGWGFWLAAGVMAAALSYLDVAGFLLLPLLLGVIVMRRQDSGRNITGGTIGCLAGFLAGAAGCVFVDAMSSGESVPEIMREWGKLYRWDDIRLSVTFSGFDTVWMITLILCIMAWGIFSFWCSGEEDKFTVWIFCLSIAVLLRCLGMFTAEMNGFCYILFFSAVLAGLGIRESVAACPAGKPGRETGEDAVRISGESTQTIEEEKGTVKDRAESRDGAGNSDNTEKRPTDTGEKETMVGNGGLKENAEKKRKIEFLENPLPLPKKHEKRVMDYKLDSGIELGGYDIIVADDDDFDH